MNITSSYQVRIVNCSVNLIDTVRIYPEALSYLIGVVSENWDAVKSITTGALEQQRYIEKLVHGNKNREAKYQEFDKMFHKYPSYLRRATITAAIGAVSSYRSNLANWENTDKHAEMGKGVKFKLLPCQLARAGRDRGRIADLFFGCSHSITPQCCTT